MKGGTLWAMLFLCGELCSGARPKPAEGESVGSKQDVTAATPVPTSLPAVTSPATSPTTSPSPPTTQVIPTTTVTRSPCKCKDGACLCCTGYILSRFNFTTQNKACLKIEYEPDEFEFNIKFLFNNRMLYQRRISGKNPQPICLPIRRIISINACIKLSNVYMIGRNIHACLDFKGDWNDEIELFSVSFECFRLGVDGIALVKPEEGGGLPVPVHNKPSSPPDDYDDSARAVAPLDYEEEEEDEERPGFFQED